jgi:hypothetical protein
LKLLRRTSQLLGLSGIFLFSTFGTGYAQGPHSILFDLKNGKTYVDGNSTQLDVPAAVIHDRLFVPVRFLSKNLGFQVNWDALSNEIKIQVGGKIVSINAAKNQALIDNQPASFDSLGVISGNRLLLSARTMANLVNIPINYDPVSSQVSIAPEVSKPSVNQSPVAKFETDKDSYRIGEQIQYKDTSSDPESDPLTVSWQGKEPVFFTPGDHVVTLMAKDNKGNISQYSKTIKVTKEVLITQDEYPFYYGSLTGNPKALPIDLNQFVNYPVIAPKEERDSTRKLIFSDSPEIFHQYGILYQDKIAGKARLYLTGQNGVADSARINVVVTNPTDHPITVQTTHRGDTPASYHAEILGNIALIDWFKNENAGTLVVPPGQSMVYYQSPVLLQNQAVHSIRDLEVVDGEGIFTFVAAGANDDALSFKKLPILQGYDSHDRGTFSVSGIHWDIDASGLQGKPASISVGEEGRTSKQWLFGTDALTGSPAQNLGNYGVLYDATIHSPGKSVICLVPLGGYFKGSVLYNNTITYIPTMGGIERGTAYVIGRTTGDEDQVHLQFMPPSGSFLPFSILIYPLDDRK